MDIVILLAISAIILAATFLALIAKFLKQPLIPAYVLAGVLIGPFGFGLIKNIEIVTLFSELGIAFLLFIVGLEISFRRLRNVGFISSIIGVAQVAVVTLVGYAAAVFLGFSAMEAMYIGLILAFSSTMVVIKMMADKGELDTLHGRLMIGILLTQDVIVIFVLSVLMNLGSLNSELIVSSALKGLGMLTLAILASRFILPHISRFVADSLELLFLYALSWCFVLMGVAYYSGFSIAIGAFIAGVSLAAFPYNLEIISRMKSLKDFFITIFFVSLGMELAFVIDYAMLLPIIVFSVLVIWFKPFVITVFSGLFKYCKRTSFLTSIGLAQISEFSLIIAAQGFNLGHISQSLFSVTVLLALITITISTYFIKFDKELFDFFSGPLTMFERSTHEKEELELLPKKLKNHTIVCGAHRMGSSIIGSLKKLGNDFLVVDYDPCVIRYLISQNVNCIYGDIGDLEILNRIKLKNAEMVISTVPDLEDNLLLIGELRKKNKKAMIFVAARQLDDALQLYEAGADYVIVPRLLSGDWVASILRRRDGKTGVVDQLRKEHIEELEGKMEEEILERYQPKFLRSLKSKFKK